MAEKIVTIIKFKVQFWSYNLTVLLQGWFDLCGQCTTALLGTKRCLIAI